MPARNVNYSPGPRRGVKAGERKRNRAGLPSQPRRHRRSRPPGEPFYSTTCQPTPAQELEEHHRRTDALLASAATGTELAYARSLVAHPPANRPIEAVHGWRMAPSALDAAAIRPSLNTPKRLRCHRPAAWGSRRPRDSAPAGHAHADGRWLPPGSQRRGGSGGSSRLLARTATAGRGPFALTRDENAAGGPARLIYTVDAQMGSPPQADSAAGLTVRPQFAWTVRQTAQSATDRAQKSSPRTSSEGDRRIEEIRRGAFTDPVASSG